MSLFRIKRCIKPMVYFLRKKVPIQVLVVSLLLVFLYMLLKKRFIREEHITLEKIQLKKVTVNLLEGIISIGAKGEKPLIIYLQKNLKVLNRTKDALYLLKTDGIISIKAESSDVLAVYNDHIEVHLEPFKWYGCGELTKAPWPLNYGDTPSQVQPFLTGDVYAGEWGGVIEPYWLSSANVALAASGNSLEIGMSRTKLIMHAKELKLSIYFGKNLREVHLKVINERIGKPDKVPDKDLIIYPIWSTWAEHKDAVDERTVLDYAREILSHGFPTGLFEIDDRWSTKYGDVQFDEQKFPDPASMVSTLHKSGFTVSVWMHPFVNLDSKEFNKEHLIKTPEGEVGLSKWWRGICGLYDFTDPANRQYFINLLESLRKSTGVDTFKFDGGEANFLPKDGRLFSSTNPDDFGYYYLQTLSQVGSKTWARVGIRTQRLSLFTHIMDRESSWSDLRTVIPLVLTFSVLGYPFVVPDMVGGNEYSEKADFELFARWIEVNAFLPCIQFSIKPWRLDASNVSLKMLKLRQKFNDYLLKTADECILTGAPFVRPLWWIDSKDEYSQIIDDQFLVGDKLLIAPVIHQGHTTRDIYLPAGIWKSGLRDKDVTIYGPKWLRNYRANIDELPYFIKNDFIE